MTRSVSIEEPVAGASGFELVVGQDLERQLESAVQLVLPLLGEAAGADDQAPLQVAAGDQLLDQQPRHDGLARAGVVGEQEAQRLARQHRVVDAGDLVRQRVDHRRVDRQQRVEQVREADALRLRHQPEQRAVAVEAPRPPLGDDLEPGLVVAVEQFVRDRAGRRLVGQFERFRAEPLHADDRDQAVGMHAADGATGLQVFKLHDSLCRLVSAGGLRRWTVLGRRPPWGVSDVFWHSPCDEQPDDAHSRKARRQHRARRPEMRPRRQDVVHNRDERGFRNR